MERKVMCNTCFDTGCSTGGIGMWCDTCYVGCCNECEVGLKRTYGNSYIQHVTYKTIKNLKYKESLKGDWK